MPHLSPTTSFPPPQINILFPFSSSRKIVLLYRHCLLDSSKRLWKMYIFIIIVLTTLLPASKESATWKDDLVFCTQIDQQKGAKATMEMTIEYIRSWYFVHCNQIIWNLTLQGNGFYQKFQISNQHEMFARRSRARRPYQHHCSPQCPCMQVYLNRLWYLWWYCWHP